MKIVEFKVKPVTRWIITKYEGTEDLGSSGVIGEFNNHQHAIQTAQCIYESYPRDSDTRVALEF